MCNIKMVSQFLIVMHVFQSKKNLVHVCILDTDISANSILAPT